MCPPVKSVKIRKIISIKSCCFGDENHIMIQKLEQGSTEV